MTSSGVVLGTVSYMSPEQALGPGCRPPYGPLQPGRGSVPDGRREVAILRSTVPETLARILHTEPEALGRLNYELPADLERAVRKCLEKDRERRYQSARELLVDLRNLERSSASVARALPRSAVIRAVIVDDEELARQLLREYLSGAEGVRDPRRMRERV